MAMRISKRFIIIFFVGLVVGLSLLRLREGLILAAVANTASSGLLDMDDNSNWHPTSTKSTAATNAAATNAAATHAAATHAEATNAAATKQHQQHQGGGEEEENKKKKPILIGTFAGSMMYNLPFPRRYRSGLYPGPVPPEKLTGDCSCRNPNAEFKHCCRRQVFRTHKMGYVLTTEILDSYKPQIELYDSKFHIRKFYPSSDSNAVDYRTVAVWRDIYSSLVSGYLYHKTGRECWLDSMGIPTQHLYPTTSPSKWDRYVTTYDLSPPKNGRSLCQYLADEDEETGMRAYTEWFFNGNRGLLQRIAISHQFQQARDHVLVVRYEDLASPNTKQKEDTVNRILNFLYNGTSYRHWLEEGGGGSAEGRELGGGGNNSSEKKMVYSGGHSTSSDPALRNRLKTIIKDLDRSYYNGEIAWVNSFVVAD